MTYLRYAAVCAIVCVGGSDAIAKTVNAQAYIADDMRAAKAAVPLRVEVGQAEIKSDINSSNLGLATGGGLLGAIIQSAVDSARAKKAEVLITPIRDGLTGFDVDGLAIDTAKAEAAEIAWIDASNVSFSKDASAASRMIVLDGLPQNKLAYTSFTYDAAPDFSAIRLVQTFEVAHKETVDGQGLVIKPIKRFDHRNLTYTQTVTVVVRLPNATTDKAANAAIWAEAHSRRAQQAIGMAFAECKRQMVRLVNSSRDDVASYGSKTYPRVAVPPYSGRQINGPSDKNTLLWLPGFVSIVSLPEGPAQ